MEDYDMDNPLGTIQKETQTHPGQSGAVETCLTILQNQEAIYSTTGPGLRRRHQCCHREWLLALCLLLVPGSSVSYETVTIVYH